MRLGCLVLIMCRSGEATGTYDGRKLTIRTGDCCILFSGHVVKFDSQSTDFDSDWTILHQTFSKRIRHLWSLDYKIALHEHPIIHMHKEEQSIFYHSMKLQRLTCQSHLTEAEDISEQLFEITFALFHDFATRHGLLPANDKAEKAQDYLFERFHDLIVEQHQQHRKVVDYASQMGITSKYLSKIVKQATGISANAWIDRHVIITAKNLLGVDTRLNIQQVSNILHFPDEASFCKYFKRLTGMTPSQYRTAALIP